MAGIVVVALIVGLFAMLTDPLEVDAEEETGVVKQHKRRWWRR